MKMRCNRKFGLENGPKWRIGSRNGQENGKYDINLDSIAAPSRDQFLHSPANS